MIESAQIPKGQKEELLAHIGSWSRDLNTGEIYWSNEHYRIFGYTDYSTEITMELIYDHIHPDDREKFNYEIELSNMDLGIFSFEFRIITKDGKLKKLMSRGEVERDSEGKSLG